MKDVTRWEMKHWMTLYLWDTSVHFRGGLIYVGSGGLKRNELLCMMDVYVSHCVIVRSSSNMVII